MTAVAKYRLAAASIIEEAQRTEVSRDAVVEEVSAARDEARERVTGAVNDFLVTSSFMDRARDASDEFKKTLEEDYDPELSSGIFSVHSSLDSLLNARNQDELTDRLDSAEDSLQTFFKNVSEQENTASRSAFGDAIANVFETGIQNGGFFRKSSREQNP